MSRSEGKITIDAERCKGCGLCISACPQRYLKIAPDVDRRGIRIACTRSEKSCTGCTLCYVICPDVAITVSRSIGDSRSSKIKG